MMRLLSLVVFMSVLGALELTPEQLEAHVSGPIQGNRIVSTETYRHWTLSLPGAFPAGTVAGIRDFDKDATLTLHIWTRGERAVQSLGEASGFNTWRDLDMQGLQYKNGQLNGTVVVHAHENGDGSSANWPSHRWTINLQLNTSGTLVHGQAEVVHAFARVDSALTKLPDGSKRHVDEVLAERERRFAASAQAVQVVVVGSVLTSQEERQATVWPAGADWTHWTGSQGTMRGAAADRPLVAHARDAHLVWRAEADLPLGGKGQVTRYGDFGDSLRNPSGGGASPIIADGKVYLYFYQPAGDPYVKKEEEKRQPTGYFIKDMWRTLADEHIACFDAVTGERVWEMVYPLAGMTFLEGKSSMTNNTPAIGEGVIVVRSSSQRVFCLDKDTGEERWQIMLPGGLDAVKRYGLTGKAAGGRAHPRAVTIAGGMAFVDARSTMIALRLSDGVEVWRRDEVLGAQYTPQVWRHGNTTALIVQSDSGVLRAIDIADPQGKDLWTKENMTEHHYQTINNFVIGDRVLVQGPVAAYTDPKAQSQHYGRTISCYLMSTAGLTLQWELSGDRYCWPHNGGLMMSAIDDRHVAMFQGMTSSGRIGLPGFIVVDIETGAVVQEILNTGNGSPRYLMSVMATCDNLVISHVDVQHSEQGFNGFELLDHQLHPVFLDYHFGPAETTSYETPTVNPFVAGRFFVRGAYGLHCYDFRQRQFVQRRLHLRLRVQQAVLPVELVPSQTQVQVGMEGEDHVLSGVDAQRSVLIRLKVPQAGNT